MEQPFIDPSWTEGLPESRLLEDHELPGNKDKGLALYGIPGLTLADVVARRKKAREQEQAVVTASPTSPMEPPPNQAGLPGRF